MKIFVDENIPLGTEAFQAHGEVLRFAGRSLTAEALKESQAEALIVRSITKVNAHLLTGTSIRFVATATIGTDHVDQAFLKSCGIGFTASPGCNANSVGEYVITALAKLEVEKGFTLAGKVLGIIGYGHVGKNLAKKAEALGLKVLKCDPPLQAIAAKEGKLGLENAPQEVFSDLGTLLKSCDILSLHVPLTSEGPHPTLNLVNADFIAGLSKPIVLINTCRGEVIEEEALHRAIEKGQIRHLVLDVFAKEPNIDPLLCKKADFITPHIAGYSLQGKLNGTEQVANAFRAFFQFQDRWKAQHPGPEEPVLDFSLQARKTDLTASEIRYACFTNAYDLTRDDARLRSSLLEEHPGKIFDQLRRDYPIRHEFPGFIIRGLPLEYEEIRSQLTRLGFQVE